MQKRELRRAVFGDESCIGRLPWLNTAVLVDVGVTVVSFVLLQIAPVLTWMAKTPLYHISTYLGLIGAVLMALDLFTNRGLWRSLVILDLKEIDPERHRQLTGKDNANILAMARHISDLGIPLWIRHVLVPGLTDDEEGLRRTADFIRSLKTVQRVEVLPYHTLGLFKWQKLGIPYPLPDAVPPTAEQVKRAEELLEVSRYPG